jgi:hypothetical protein
MRQKRAVIGAVAVILLLAAGAPPAHALGNRIVGCPPTSGYWKGVSWSGGAQTYPIDGCNGYSSGSQARYNAYPGSPSYLTGINYGYPSSVIYQSGTYQGIHYPTGVGSFTT